MTGFVLACIGGGLFAVAALYGGYVSFREPRDFEIIVTEDLLGGGP